MYLAFEFLPKYSAMSAEAEITAVSFYSAENRNTRKNDITDIEMLILPADGPTTAKVIVK
ncbi:MAG: hypothetical protein HDT06_03075 [Bacteroidales bacterium]|nr:hypothetical protein [Bacteroidales bacterium]